MNDVPKLQAFDKLSEVVEVCSPCGKISQLLEDMSFDFDKDKLGPGHVSKIVTLIKSADLYVQQETGDGDWKRLVGRWKVAEDFYEVADVQFRPGFAEGRMAFTGSMNFKEMHDFMFDSLHEPAPVKETDDAYAEDLSTVAEDMLNAVQTLTEEEDKHDMLMLMSVAAHALGPEYIRTFMELYHPKDETAQKSLNSWYASEKGQALGKRLQEIETEAFEATGVQA